MALAKISKIQGTAVYVQGNDIDGLLKQHLHNVIGVFHPSCGHCVAMKPEWNKFKKVTSQLHKKRTEEAKEISEQEQIKIKESRKF